MLKIHCQWMDRPHIVNELDATFCELEVWVGDCALTKVLRAKEEERNHIRVPAYPLAEWLACNWWAFFFEGQLPWRRKDDYALRHAWLFGAEGYVLPDILFVPQLPHVQILVRENRQSLSRVVFRHTAHTFSVTQEELHHALTAFIKNVVARLEAHGLTDTPLQEQWSAIEAAEKTPDEKLFCTYAGFLGADPFDLDEEDAEALIDVYNALPQQVCEDFFSSADMALLRQHHDIFKTFYRCAHPSHASSALWDFKKECMALSPEYTHAPMPPWSRGYDMAQKVRGLCANDATIFATPHSLFQHVGIDISAGKMWSEVPMTPTLATPKPFFAMVRTHEDKTHFAYAKASSQQEVFYAARALYAYLTMDTDISLVTTADTGHQQASRAFAAELLVPATRLKKQLGNQGVVTGDDIADLAHAFNISDYVVHHQIENHNLAEIR